MKSIINITENRTQRVFNRTVPGLAVVGDVASLINHNIVGYDVNVVDERGSSKPLFSLTLGFDILIEYVD